MAKDKEGFEALIPFFMPEKANMAIRMRVSANGEVYISKKIIDSVRKENENMWVDFRHSEDYRTLAIRPGGSIRFSSAENRNDEISRIKGHFTEFWLCNAGMVFFRVGSGAKSVDGQAAGSIGSAFEVGKRKWGKNRERCLNTSIRRRINLSVICISDMERAWITKNVGELLFWNMRK